MEWTAEMDGVFQREVKARFPDGAVQRVVLMQYGDHPVIGPGEVGVRLVIEPAGGPDGHKRALQAFENAHTAAVKDLRRDLPQVLPRARRLEVTSDDTGDPDSLLTLQIGQEPGPAGLTPVMARLGPVDLETLDALITAGIVANRAEGVRWALARIRERPAYGQLRDRAREIERLKTEF